MISSLTLTAFAGDPDPDPVVVDPSDWGRLDTSTEGRNVGTITINNAEDGETYNAYKILDLYSFVDNDPSTATHSRATEHYAYMVKDESDAGWDGFIKKYSTAAEDSDNTNDYFIIDTANPVTYSGATYYPVYSTDLFNFTSTTDEVDHAGSIDTTNNTYKKVQLFARDALKWAKDHSTKCAANYTRTATSGSEGHNGEVEGTTESGKVQIVYTGVPLGYYLIDSSIGSMVALDTTNRNVTMYDKNDNPSIIKKVREKGHDDIARSSGVYGNNFDTVWKENVDYEIGQKVTFLIQVHLYKGAKGYKIYDALEKGFKLNLNATGTDFAVDAFKLYAGTSDEMTLITKGTGTYDYVLSGDDLHNCTFMVTFADTFLDGLKEDSYIEIEYETYLTKDAYVKDASVNESAGTVTTNFTNLEAGVADPGKTTGNKIENIKVDNNGDNLNTNSAILLFGNNSSTKWDTATVETYQFDLVKTEETINDGTNDSTFKLLGTAKFELYRSKKNATTGAQLDEIDSTTATGVVHFAKTDDVYRVKRLVGNDSDKETAVTGDTVLESSATGELNICGLEAGTYYLKETYAPTGFHKLDGTFKIVILPDNDTANNDNAGKIYYTYTNSNDTAVSGRANGSADEPLNWDATVVNNGTQSTAATSATYTSGGTNGGIQIINTTTTELPSTGGMGTTVLYIVGGMLIVLAGAYLFFSRKRTA